LRTTPRNAAPEPARLPRDLIVLCVAFFFIFLGPGALQQYVDKVLGAIEPWTGISNGRVLITLYTVFLVWRIFISYSMAFFGPRLSITLGVLAYALFALGLRFVRVPWAPFAFAALWGWGAASAWIASSTRILDLTESSHYGRSSGIFHASVSLGQWLGVIVLGWIGMRGMEIASPDRVDLMLSAALLAGLIGTGVSLFLSKPAARLEIPPVREMLVMPFSRRALELGFFQFVPALTFGILLGSFKDFVGESYGIGWIGPVAQVTYGARLLAGLVAGEVSDRIGRERVLMYGFAAAAVVFAVCGAFPSLPTLMVYAGAIGLINAVVPVAAMAAIGDEARRGRRHLAFGAIYVWRDFGVIVGLASGYKLHALWSLGVVMALCAVVASLLRRSARPRPR